MATANARPRRSVLYIPGSNARALQKAATLPADCLVLDLEDAVAPEAKESARQRVSDAVAARSFGQREVVVRVNGLDTPWGAADLRYLATAGADALLLPKVSTPADVTAAESLLLTITETLDLPLWIMTETARGVLELDSILSAHPSIKVVVMGTSDLAKEMRVSPDGERPGLLQALGHCVLTARACGIDIIDGVYLKLDDDAGYRTACEQGRALGFDGKSLIHPRQLEAANSCFGVSETDLAGARETITAWEQARQRGDGITVLRGRLIEQLHVDEARRVIRLHESILAIQPHEAYNDGND